MKNLWNIQFNPVENEITPDEIIKGQCEILEQKTNGRILGKVTCYDGPITSYTTTSWYSVTQALAGKRINIQEDLGNISDGNFTFEFFITSTSTPNYKYRVLFLNYEIPFYPLFIVLDEAIAKEIDLDHNLRCESQDAYEGLLEKILSSERIERIIGTLLAIAQRDEQKSLPLPPPNSKIDIE